MANLKTALYDLHQTEGARMVPFAGYDMPVQYPDGIIKEHLHTRTAAGLFDVSHMGQVIVEGAQATAELEALMPADLVALQPLHSTYSLLTNAEGGVLDDLIVTRLSDTRFMIVVNAVCKHADLEVLKAGCPLSTVTLHEDCALLALQGPKARDVMTRLAPDAAQLSFMTAKEVNLAGIDCFVTCSGYTGEDGFEISLPNQAVQHIAKALLAEPEVALVGLGARDSLRLEAGLSLYGHELSTTITPVEAGLRWAIAKSRRADGERAGGYPGADVIMDQFAAGTARVRVGLQVVGKRPVRDGQLVVNDAGETVGVVSSGGFGPSVGAPVALAFVDSAYKTAGTRLMVDVRGTMNPVDVVALPMVPPGYHRG